MTNTIDATVPTSSVAALPANEPTSFTVNWSGQDTGGSGIASYDVYDSVNGGAYTLWQNDTTATSAIFTGTVGDTYAFYSVATSNVGTVQPMPTAAQASTTVKTSTVAVTGVSPASGPGAGGTPVTITGTNFTGATAVYFGPTKAAKFTVNSQHADHGHQPGGDRRGGRDGDYAERDLAGEPPGRSVQLRAGGDEDQPRGGTGGGRHLGDHHGHEPARCQVGHVRLGPTP